jgi:hypothetical protein
VLKTTNTYKIGLVVCCAIMMMCLLSSVGFADFQYDWNVRTDQYGKGAGVFEVTPFPIDETMTTYAIIYDEGTVTYNLGTIYFIDNNASGCSNGTTTYNPQNRTCGGGSGTVYTTIANGLSAVTSGNKTILIREGTYRESYLNPKNGVDDTHRYMLCGYKQERPIIDGNNHPTNDVVRGTGQTNAYVTLQRLKIQNGQASGILMGNDLSTRDAYVNIVDVWVYNVPNSSTGVRRNAGIYMMNADNAHIYHCTSERHYGHCYKIGDGADDAIVEWSIAKECGYFPGMPETSYYNSHPMGINFPNDTGAFDDSGSNHIARYNIAHDVLFYGIYTRRTPNILVHHNEVYSASRCWAQMSNPAADCENHSEGNYQTELSIGPTSGNWYSNLIRDPGNLYGGHIKVTSCDTNNPVLNIYNNIFYGGGSEAIMISQNNTGATIRLMNNSVYGNYSKPIIISYMGATAVILKNNILYQEGSGSCLSVGQAVHTNNQYYYPNGSRGVLLSAGEADGSPDDFVSLLTGPYNPNALVLKNNILGENLSSLFTRDFNSMMRNSWTKGAYECIKPSPPSNLQIILD